MTTKLALIYAALCLALSVNALAVEPEVDRNTGFVGPDGKPVPSAPRSDRQVLDDVMDGAAREAGVELHPEQEPAGQGVNLRPLDDSDPEMRDLVVLFYETVPCGNVAGGICPEAEALLTGGGDRLARYLARQVDANEAEGWPSQGDYIYLVGRTRSRAAFDYLRARGKRLADEGEHDPLLWTLEALGDLQTPEAATEARRLADRFPGDEGLDSRAKRAERKARD